ncbi:MAG: LytTR family DNA-binding domain-containing protein [Nocardioides sp.]
MSSATAPSSPPALRVLVVDDERPTLDELGYLLSLDPRVGDVRLCDSATDGLRLLRQDDIDCVFLDVQMPGLSGLELAEVLRRFRTPPAIVFVTAHEGHAVDAFDLRAVDYVLKPVRAARLAEAVRRVVDGADRVPAAAPDLQIAVERGGVTRFVERSQVTHVKAQGDYARLHTAAGSHLLRIPLSALEQEWGPAGFVRIHRSVLVSLAHVSELRMDAGRCSVVVGAGQSAVELVVSRRNTRDLRERLLHRSGS